MQFPAYKASGCGYAFLLLQFALIELCLLKYFP